MLHNFAKWLQQYSWSPSSSEPCHSMTRRSLLPVSEHFPWQTECDDRDLVWLLRLGPKRRYSFCLPLSFRTHPWNLATRLQGNPGLRGRPPWSPGISAAKVSVTTSTGCLPVSDRAWEDPHSSLQAMLTPMHQRGATPFQLYTHYRFLKQNKHCCFKPYVSE